MLGVNSILYVIRNYHELLYVLDFIFILTSDKIELLQDTIIGHSPCYKELMGDIKIASFMSYERHI